MTFLDKWHDFLALFLSPEAFPVQAVSSALRASPGCEREDKSSDGVAALILTLTSEKTAVDGLKRF